MGSSMISETSARPNPMQFEPKKMQKWRREMTRMTYSELNTPTHTYRTARGIEHDVLKLSSQDFAFCSPRSKMGYRTCQVGRPQKGLQAKDGKGFGWSGIFCKTLWHHEANELKKKRLTSALESVMFFSFFLSLSFPLMSLNFGPNKLCTQAWGNSFGLISNHGQFWIALARLEWLTMVTCKRPLFGPCPHCLGPAGDNATFNFTGLVRPDF